MEETTAVAAIVEELRCVRTDLIAVVGGGIRRYDDDDDESKPAPGTFSGWTLSEETKPGVCGGANE